MLGILRLLLAAQLGAGAPDADQADIAWIAEGEFCEPETVLALPDDTLLVSNVCDFRTAGDGFLTLLSGDGRVLDWRVVKNLDSPLGMTLVDERLYVIDNNAVRIFSWPGFEPQSSIPLDTSVANDIAVAKDGAIFVTDTVRGEVVVIDADMQRSVLTGSSRFPGANGIHIHDTDLYIGGERLWHVDLRDVSVTTFGPDWLVDIDGIEMEADGTLQVTPVGGPLVRLAPSIEVLGGEGVSSANHGYLESFDLVLIPTGFDNTVIALRVPMSVTPQN